MNYWLVPTLVLALGFFGVGACLASKLKSPFHFWSVAVAGLVISLPAISYSAYYLRVFSEPLWLYEFRSWPGSEIAASGAGFLGGLLHGRFAGGPRFRRVAGRWFFPGVLFLGLIVPYLKPILRPPRWNEFQDRWSEGVCRQSSESSCGPACAATLLRRLGKTATEKEIAQAAFTSRSGTENWYLARALRTRGVRVQFQFLRDPKQPWPVPAVAGVRLPDCGNAGHFVAVLDQDALSITIGDPLEGKLKLPKTTAKYQFTGFFMKVEVASNCGRLKMAGRESDNRVR